jgi:hypothetical protein
MIIHKDSHTDHAINQAQWHFILDSLEDRTGFFIETLELPQGLGFVLNELYGPSAGDPPVPEAEVHYGRRGDRAWDSRLVKMPKRPTRFIRVIAGPHDGEACVLFTAYAVSSKDMPQSPKEPGDIRKQLEELEARRRELGYRGEEHDKVYAQIEALRPKRDEADEFWSSHALATEAY